MELYFLRHGIAVEPGSPKYPQDSDRPLTSRGIEEMKRITTGIKRLGCEIDWIYSSPYLRAKQTAQIAAKKLKLTKKLSYLDALSSEGNFRELIETLRKKVKQNSSILLVGHEPYLSSLVSTLISKSPQANIVLKKGGLCKVVIDQFLRFDQCGELCWLLTPKQLMKF